MVESAPYASCVPVRAWLLRCQFLAGVQAASACALPRVVVAVAACLRPSVIGYCCLQPVLVLAAPVYCSVVLAAGGSDAFLAGYFRLSFLHCLRILARIVCTFLCYGPSIAGASTLVQSSSSSLGILSCDSIHVLDITGMVKLASCVLLVGRLPCYLVPTAGLGPRSVALSCSFCFVA